MTEEYLRAHTVCELTPLSGSIRLVDYDPEWPLQFERHASRIRSALGGRALRVEHAGSTSVPGLPAKPIVDIVLVVENSGQEAEYAGALENAGYRLQIREPEWFEHRMFVAVENAVNLHVFSAGGPEVERMLVFRDWLRNNDGDRNLYARTKQILSQQDWKYTQNYADAKTSVVNEIMSRALAAGSPSQR